MRSSRYLIITPDGYVYKESYAEGNEDITAVRILVNGVLLEDLTRAPRHMFAVLPTREEAQQFRLEAEELGRLRRGIVEGAAAAGPPGAAEAGALLAAAPAPVRRRAREAREAVPAEGLDGRRG